MRLCIIAGCLEQYLIPISEQNREKGYIQIASLYEILDKIGNNEKVIIHVLAGRGEKEAYEKYDGLKQRYSNFDYYCGFSHKDLIERVSTYDYGCLFMGNGEIPPDDYADTRGYYGVTYRLAVSNKFYDFLDAEIPIITSLNYEQTKMLDKFGVIVDMNMETINIEELLEKRNSYKSNILKAKEYFLMENQIDDWLDFVNNVGKCCEN